MSSNLVRGWTSAALGAAWILVWGWLGTTARAEEFLNVYGVAVHLFATPNCKPPVSEWPVSVKVAPFEERANLSEVVSELARRSPSASAAVPPRPPRQGAREGAGGRWHRGLRHRLDWPRQAPLDHQDLPGTCAGNTAAGAHLGTFSPVRPVGGCSSLTPGPRRAAPAGGRTS